MATRKEEQAKRRAERLEAERRAAQSSRSRLILGYVVAGLLSLAVVAGIIVAITSGGDSETDAGGGNAEGLPEAAHIETFFGSVNDFEPDAREGTPPPPLEQGDLEVAAKAANCKLELDLPDEGADHLNPDAKRPEYESNPATSGPHVEPPHQQADGAYLEAVEPFFWVHSLEHGRIVVQYSPDLPEDQQLELKGMFDEDPTAMILTPNPDIPYDVAASAWTNLIGCKSFEGGATIDALRVFRDTFRGQGPEPVGMTAPS